MILDFEFWKEAKYWKIISNTRCKILSDSPSPLNFNSPFQALFGKIFTFSFYPHRKSIRTGPSDLICWEQKKRFRQNLTITCSSHSVYVHYPAKAKQPMEGKKNRPIWILAGPVIYRGGIWKTGRRRGRPCKKIRRYRWENVCIDADNPEKQTHLNNLYGVTIQQHIRRMEGATKVKPGVRMSSGRKQVRRWHRRSIPCNLDQQSCGSPYIFFGNVCHKFLDQAASCVIFKRSLAALHSSWSPRKSQKKIQRGVRHCIWLVQ